MRHKEPDELICFAKLDLVESFTGLPRVLVRPSEKMILSSQKVVTGHPTDTLSLSILSNIPRATGQGWVQVGGLRGSSWPKR